MLNTVMNKRKLEIDNKLLIFAIQRTANFEQLLTKNFLGRSIPKPSLPSGQEIAEQDWKPFLGMISQCFDAHFDIYVNFTDQYIFFEIEVQWWKFNVFLTI
jgi:hypothetical protein